jgi:RNA-directed DNA polymerase
VLSKVKEITRSGTSQSLDQLLHRLNPVLRGWCAYFRSGQSSRTFQYLATIRGAESSDGCDATRDGTGAGCAPPTRVAADRPGQVLYPAAVSTTRYRYRAARIQTPWQNGWIAEGEPTVGLERLQGLIAR